MNRTRIDPPGGLQSHCRQGIGISFRLAPGLISIWDLFGRQDGLARFEPSTDSAGAGSRQGVSPHGTPRTPAPGPSAALSNTPRTGGCYRHEIQEAAERAAALGGPRGDFAPAFARCLRIASITSWSLINAIILISAPQLGHSNGSTS